MRGSSNFGGALVTVGKPSFYYPLDKRADHEYKSRFISANMSSAHLAV